MSVSPPLVPATEVGPDPVADTQRVLFTLLFNKYRGALLSHVTRLVRSSDDAAELVQETYLRVMKQAPMAEFDTVARAYLFQTATNLARDHFRRQRWRTHEPLESVPEPEAPRASSSPEDLPIRSEAMEALFAELHNMPDTTRDVFIRARFDGCSYSEIARDLGTSVRTVERRMSEALGLLSARLEDLL